MNPVTLVVGNTLEDAEKFVAARNDPPTPFKPIGKKDISDNKDTPTWAVIVLNGVDLPEKDRMILEELVAKTYPDLEIPNGQGLFYL